MSAEAAQGWILLILSVTCDWADLHSMKVRVIAEIERGGLLEMEIQCKRIHCPVLFSLFSLIMIWWKMVFVKIIVRDDHHEKFVKENFIPMKIMER